MSLAVRSAQPEDAEAIARVHAEGIDDRVATFATVHPEAEGVAAAIAGGELILVAERDGRVIGFAKAAPYDDCASYYGGVSEATVYVAREARRTGAGRALVEALAEAAAARGDYKLIGKVFTSNEGSLRMFSELGWREVGVHVRHGRLDGEWKDVMVVEHLLGPARG